MTNDYYNRKYAEGDFHYNPEYERTWLQNHLVDRFDMKPGDRVLDLGCGKGLHASLLADLGFRVFGVEKTVEGVKGAKQRGSAAEFIQASAADLATYFDESYFDLIFCRGMSWFHRELHVVCPVTGVNVSEKVPELFRFIKPGGLFVLQISTDFSGNHPERDTHNRRLSEFVRLFELHGEIVHKSNWNGVEVYSNEQAADVKGNLVIATRK
ncbi:MAG: methyltransferase domain-containing protein [Planctomycetaceae bacterium]|nr:methyltransferase domain-containing protein [Planctomycetaceae bacterium]MCA9022582.1 methyltransferase domain-containing protein [Planctomycetaceae bacterium]